MKLNSLIILIGVIISLVSFSGNGYGKSESLPSAYNPHDLAALVDQYSDFLSFRIEVEEAQRHFPELLADPVAVRQLKPEEKEKLVTKLEHAFREMLIENGIQDKLIVNLSGVVKSQLEQDLREILVLLHHVPITVKIGNSSEKASWQELLRLKIYFDSKFSLVDELSVGRPKANPAPEIWQTQLDTNRLIGLRASAYRVDKFFKSLFGLRKPGSSRERVFQRRQPKFAQGQLARINSLITPAVGSMVPVLAMAINAHGDWSQMPWTQLLINGGLTTTIVFFELLGQQHLSAFKSIGQNFALVEEGELLKLKSSDNVLTFSLLQTLQEALSNLMHFSILSPSHLTPYTLAVLPFLTAGMMFPIEWFKMLVLKHKPKESPEPAYLVASIFFYSVFVVCGAKYMRGLLDHSDLPIVGIANATIIGIAVLGYSIALTGNEDIKRSAKEIAFIFKVKLRNLHDRLRRGSLRRSLAEKNVIVGSKSVEETPLGISVYKPPLFEILP